MTDDSMLVDKLIEAFKTVFITLLFMLVMSIRYAAYHMNISNATYTGGRPFRNAPFSQHFFDKFVFCLVTPFSQHFRKNICCKNLEWTIVPTFVFNCIGKQSYTSTERFHTSIMKLFFKIKLSLIRTIYGFLRGFRDCHIFQN